MQQKSAIPHGIALLIIPVNHTINAKIKKFTQISGRMKLSHKQSAAKGGLYEPPSPNGKQLLTNQ